MLKLFRMVEDQVGIGQGSRCGKLRAAGAMPYGDDRHLE